MKMLRELGAAIITILIFFPVFGIICLCFAMMVTWVEGSPDMNGLLFGVAGWIAGDIVRPIERWLLKGMSDV